MCSIIISLGATTEKHMSQAQEILDISKCDSDVKLISEFHAERVSYHSTKVIYTFKDESTIVVGE